MYKNEQDNALMSSSIASPLSNVMLREFCSLICAENNCIINRTLPKKKNMTLYHTYMYISAILSLILIKEKAELYFGVLADKLQNCLNLNLFLTKAYLLSNTGRFTD